MTRAYLFYLSVLSARTLLVALSLLLGLRLLGKRQLGQMNIYDLAMIMALANAVQNAMTNGTGDLSGGMVTSGTLILLAAILSAVFVRLPRLEQRAVGSPTLLVNNGCVLEDHMRREHVTHGELLEALREHGLTSPDQALLVALEVDGTLSVVPGDARNHRLRRAPAPRPAP